MNIWNVSGNWGGRPRLPGAGGFHSRPFGTRHHPSAFFRSTSSNSNGSSAHNKHQCPIQDSSYNRNNRNNSNANSNSVENTPSTSGSREPPRSEVNGASIRIHIPFRFPNSGNPQHHHHHQRQLHPPQPGVRPSSNVNPNNGILVDGGNDNNNSRIEYVHHHGRQDSGLPNYTYEEMESSTTATETLRGGFIGPPSRRPRSQIQAVGIPGRRRSSGSGANPNQRRASTHRSANDPYYVHQNRQLVNNRQHQNTGNPPDPPRDWPTSTPTSPEASLTTPINLPDLQSNRVHSNHPVDLSTSSGGTSTARSSVSDQRWLRTKRIGLTLCIMAFILLSTVAARFFIEGPWLVDKRPRSARTEATIYFFLTELIFVAFAMALFFTGVTCLRKRTNDYLMSRFHQYILQSSQHGAGAMGSPDYFDTHTLSNQPAGTGGSSSQNNGHTDHDNSFPAFPFLPRHHFHPNESHLMINLNSIDSSSFGGSGSNNKTNVGAGYSKPPPYHIAVNLPVPDEQLMGSHVKDPNDKLLPGQHTHPVETSSWINDPDNRNNYVSGNNTEDDSEVDLEEGDREEGIPRRNRQRREGQPRAETPPPPYGQI